MGKAINLKMFWSWEGDRGMKKYWVVVSIFCLAFGSVSADAGELSQTELSQTELSQTELSETEYQEMIQERVEGEGYDSPKEAVAALVRGLQNQSVDEMMASFAVESYVENFSLEQMIEVTGVYMTESGWFPGGSDLAMQLNREKRKTEISRQLSTQYENLVQAQYIESEENIFRYEDGEETVSEFIETLFPYNFEELVIETDGVCIDPSFLIGSYASETMKKNTQRQLEYLNGDDIESVLPLIRVNGKTYLACIDTILYGDKWYVLELNGTMGSMMGLSEKYGGLLPVDDILLGFMGEMLR